MTDSMGMTLFFCYGNSWTANIAGVYLRTDLKVSSHPWTEGDILLRRFFLTELKIATWNFHPDNMVREGDSSPAANPDNGTLIAVKRIHTEGFLGYEHWLWITLLLRIPHSRKCGLHIWQIKVTLPGHHRDTPEEDTWFSSVNCNITGTGDIYLGKAWGAYSKVIYSYCHIDNIKTPQGWSDWDIPPRQRTVEFGEYQCKGKGANKGGRVSWLKSFTPREINPFLDTKFIHGEQWLRL